MNKKHNFFRNLAVSEKVYYRNQSPSKLNERFLGPIYVSHIGQNPSVIQIENKDKRDSGLTSKT